MGEIEFGPRNSAMWPQRKSFKSRRPCTQETEKEVLAQEIQQSGPRKNCLKVRVLVPKKRKKEVLAPEFQQSGPILYGKLCEIKFQTRKT